MFDREKHTISKYTNIHDSENPYYIEVLDIFTDVEREARVKDPTLTDKENEAGTKMRGGRAEDEERRRKTEEQQTTGCRRAIATGKRKTGTNVSLKIQGSHTEGGMR